METKLTLKLDKEVISAAKKYAKKRNISLSKMVEKYFSSLIKTKRGEKKYTPIVNELSGIIYLEKEFNLKEEFGQYLSDKYS